MGYVVQHNHNKKNNKTEQQKTTTTNAQHKLIERTTNEKCWRRCSRRGALTSLLAARCLARHYEMCTCVYMCTFVTCLLLLLLLLYLRICCWCCCLSPDIFALSFMAASLSNCHVVLEAGQAAGVGGLGAVLADA